MDEIAPQLEARFLVSPAEARAFLACASSRAALDLYDRERPFTFVRTTYFDSDDHELFRSQRRRRVRLREYAGAPSADGIPTLTGVCAFESKESTDGRRRKARATGDRGQLLRLLRRGPARPLDPELARAAAQVKSGWLRPRLTTFFHRISLTGDRLRITLDDRLTFARPVRLGRAGDPAEPPAVVGCGTQLVLEVKLDGRPPDWLTLATRDYLAMTRFSKFRDGMLAIDRADSLAGSTRFPRDSIQSWFRAAGSNRHELPGSRPADPAGDRR